MLDGRPRAQACACTAVEARVRAAAARARASLGGARPRAETMTGMKHIVIGTAGHIDHGKSSLVLALTGTDPDRLKEEKARGITIDLGFAHWEAPGLSVAFIDVPGHERFVKNMLAGVGGLDAVMLVVAADESVMPQTREHFAICRLLQVPAGLVVLTKIDAVEPGMIDLVRADVRDLVAGSFLEDAPVLAVSARTGRWPRRAEVGAAGHRRRRGRAPRGRARQAARRSRVLDARVRDRRRRARSSTGRLGRRHHGRRCCPATAR